MASRFDEIKARVSAKEAAQFYGIDITRHGKAHCIWHSPDRHPSLSFKDGFCKCFTCGNGGSSIDVAMQLFDLTAAEAADKLSADFGLGLDSRESVPAPIIQRQEQDRTLLAAFEQWEKTALRAITNYFRLLHRAQLLLAPETPKEEPHPLFVESLQNLSTVEYYLYVLAYGTSSEKISFFKLGRKVVKQAEQRLQHWQNQGISF